MLLVNDQKAEIAKAKIALQQLVGADQNIHLTTLHPGNDALKVLGRLKARDHLNGVRPIGKPIPEVGVVLVGQ